MDSLRLAAKDSVPPLSGCCRCHDASARWDRIAGRAFCPNCQEQLALGEGEPLVLKTLPHRCAVCERQGTVCFCTFPLESPAPLEMELCPHHLRALIARCLEPRSFRHLRRKLEALGLGVDRIFLLHEAFYDASGQASLPVMEMDY
jgi:hypothetical protein